MKRTRKLLATVLSLVMILTALPLTAITSFAETSGDFEYRILDDGTALISGYTGSATELTIPSEIDGYTVTSIGEFAFGFCESLESITIPDSVTSIGTGAFFDCTSLKSVTIPDSVTYIGDNAFSYCTSLESITIPDSVTSIGNSVFGYCTSLESITIPDSVTSIYCYAFEACELLVSITIPDSVTYIGDSAFYECTSLASITIPDSVTSIGGYAFDDTAYYNNEANWENDVLYIGNHLIEAIEARDTVSGDYTIKDGTKTISDHAFEFCTSLKSVTIPDSVTSIGSWAFSGCTSLASITIPDSVTSIGGSAFEDTAYYNNEANWENDVLYIGNHLIKAKDTVSGDYTIKDGTKTIADGAFLACSSLTSITIPDSVTRIGNYAFCACTSLTSVTIPDSVTSICDFAFCGCTSLASVTIPDSVTSIGNRAFESCTSLASITIPDSVTSIGESAFGYYYDAFDEVDHKIEGFTIYGYAGSEAERYANDNEFAFIALDKPAPSESIGDVNGDAKLSIVDAKWILQNLASTREFTDEQKAFADVNGDGKISIVDVKWILQVLAGTRELS